MTCGVAVRRVPSEEQNQMEVTIRFATAAELEGGVPINWSSFGAHKWAGPEVAKAWLGTFFLSNGGHKTVVAVVNGRVVGYVIFQATDGFRRGTTDDPVAIQLFQIAVDENYRNLKIGEQMLATSFGSLIFKWINEFNPRAHVVSLYVVFAAGNEKVYSFYERHFPRALTEKPIERVPGKPEWMRGGTLLRGTSYLL